MRDTYEMEGSLVGQGLSSVHKTGVRPGVDGTGTPSGSEWGEMDSSEGVGSSR